MQVEFKLSPAANHTTETLTPQYDLTAEDVARYYGVKTPVISWRARNNRLAELAPRLVDGTWWFRSDLVADYHLPEPSPSYRLDFRESDLAALVADRAAKMSSGRGSGLRARYTDKEGFLQHLRDLAQEHGPRYLSTYNVQKKLGKEGQALYSAGLYYCNRWSLAVDAALAPLGLTYEKDVKCSKPWQHKKTLRRIAA